jgi:hypothetical protein
MEAASMTYFVPAQAVEWVSDEPIPGLVRIELIDAEGRAWEFVDKTSMFDPDNILRPDSHYPVDISLACTLISEPDGDPGPEGDVVLVSTARPWGLETVDGTSEFWIEASRISKQET